MPNLIDPLKKSKVKTGTKAKLSRDEKGNLNVKRDKDFAGVTKETMEEDAAVANESNTGSRDYAGGPAPRVGGKTESSGPSASGTSKKKLIKMSIKNARNSSASPQAKKAAIRQLKMRK